MVQESSRQGIGGISDALNQRRGFQTIIEQLFKIDIVSKVQAKETH